MASNVDEDGAQKTSRELLKPYSGPNFDTHELIETNRIEVRATAIIRLFSRTGIVVGMIVILLAFKDEQSGAVGLFLVGFVLIIITLTLTSKLNQRVVFDPAQKVLWRATKFPAKNSKGRVLFRNVNAIQVLNEKCRTNNGHYYTRYEINLMLSDGSRFHVMNQVTPEGSKQCSERLSGLMKVPIQF